MFDSLGRFIGRGDAPFRGVAEKAIIVADEVEREQVRHKRVAQRLVRCQSLLWGVREQLENKPGKSSVLCTELGHQALERRVAGPGAPRGISVGRDRVSVHFSTRTACKRFAWEGAEDAHYLGQHSVVVVSREHGLPEVQLGEHTARRPHVYRRTKR
jgi:hypothetical protein